MAHRLAEILSAWARSRWAGKQGGWVPRGGSQNPIWRIQKLKPKLLTERLPTLCLVLLKAPHDPVLP
jgi:hypothetical protein